MGLPAVEQAAHRLAVLLEQAVGGRHGVRYRDQVTLAFIPGFLFDVLSASSASPAASMGDPMSFEVDEIVPVSKGGSPIDRANVAPAHRICNERRGNKSLAALNGSVSPRPRDVGCATSLQW